MKIVDLTGWNKWDDPALPKYKSEPYQQFLVGGFRVYDAEKDAGNEHDFIFDQYGNGRHKTDFRQHVLDTTMKWWKGHFDGYTPQFWRELGNPPVIEP